MKFIKENSYDIVRLIINQVGIMIFSLVLYTSVGTFDDSLKDPLKIIVSVFSTLFYLSLIYNVTWEYGSKDKIRVESGKISDCKFKGLFMGLLANIGNFVLGILCVISCGLFMLIGADWLKASFSVFNIITRLVEAMYLGMVQGIFAFLPEASYISFLMQSVGFIVFPVLSVLVAHFGYLLGYRDKRIFSVPDKNKK